MSLKNEQEVSRRRLARRVDLEAAVPETLSRGGLFFAGIERNQVDAARLAVLRFVAAQSEQAVVDPQTLARYCPVLPDRALERLLRRDPVEPVDGGYRLQVELIRRCFLR